jgi:hypothetical protein
MLDRHPLTILGVDDRAYIGNQSQDALNTGLGGAQMDSNQRLM